jgi:hypothetical protein
LSTKAERTVDKYNAITGRSVIGGAVGGLSGFAKAAAPYARNLVNNTGDMIGGPGPGGFDLMTGARTGRKSSGSGGSGKKKSSKKGLQSAFYDPKTGRTYVARKGKGKKKSRGPGGFNPW